MTAAPRQSQGGNFFRKLNLGIDNLLSLWYNLQQMK